MEVTKLTLLILSYYLYGIAVIGNDWSNKIYYIVDLKSQGIVLTCSV